MLGRLCGLMLLGTLAAMELSQSVLAQGPPGPPSDRGGGHHSHDTSPEGQQRRFDRAAAFLDQMDANHNGQIDAEEATGPRRSYLDRLLERAEMKPTFPLPLKRLYESLKRYYAQEAAQESGSGKPPGPPGSSKPSSSSSTTSTVPGFGSSSKPSSGSTSGSSSLRPSGTSPGSSSGSSSSGGPSMEERIRSYAGNLIRQYDTDKNGSLEKEEWSHMSMNPTDADRNHDGHITLDELPPGWWPTLRVAPVPEVRHRRRHHRRRPRRCGPALRRPASDRIVS